MAGDAGGPLGALMSKLGPAMSGNPMLAKFGGALMGGQNPMAAMMSNPGDFAKWAAQRRQQQPGQAMPPPMPVQQGQPPQQPMPVAKPPMMQPGSVAGGPPMSPQQQPPGWGGMLGGLY
jgi:hypothetical protein